MKPSIRITASGEVFEVLSERPVSGGDLFEVELRSNTHQSIYRAIVSQIQTPSPDVCEFLIEHLPNIGEFEEYEIVDMANAIRRGNKRAYTINAIADIVPYLVRVGLMSYEKKPTPVHGERFFFKRSATAVVIKRTLSSPPPPPTLAEIERAKREAKAAREEQAAREEPKPKKKKKKKAKKKKKTLVADDSPLPKKKKKKKKDKGPPQKSLSEEELWEQRKRNSEAIRTFDLRGESKKKKKKKRKSCCDDPRIVRSKSTGKRRCKNCGTKLPPKKKKTD